MNKLAKFNEYDQVRLKRDRPSVSEHPFTQLDAPRAVTTNDKGIILTVYGGSNPGYDVEFFDEEGNTLDLLMIDEDELEVW